MENQDIKPKNHLIEHLTIVVVLCLLLILMSSLLNSDNTKVIQEGRATVSERFLPSPSATVLGTHTAQ